MVHLSINLLIPENLRYEVVNALHTCVIQNGFYRAKNLVDYEIKNPVVRAYLHDALDGINEQLEIGGEWKTPIVIDYRVTSSGVILLLGVKPRVIYLPE